MTRHFPMGQKGILPVRKRRWGILLVGLIVIALCVAIRHLGGGPERAEAVPSQPAARQSPSTVGEVLPSPAPTKSFTHHGKTVPGIVAVVNGKQITRDKLAQEALRHYGSEVLDNLIRKYLILEECRRRNLTVSREEVDREIERMAKSFGLPVDQWLKMYKSEHGITAEQYAEEIIRPSLALKKLAGSNLQISREELVREYDIMFGEMIRARLISCKSREKAEKIRELAAANPKQFTNLAKEYSEDKASAAAGGLIQPIRKHGSFPEIEQAVFSLADGEISPVIHVADQYVILMREGAIPARKVKLDDVASKLEELIRDRKRRALATEISGTLVKNARVEKCFDDPIKAKQMPSVAATINGRPMITTFELAQACIDRHGEDVLEGLINRTLLELECQKRQVTVSQQEMEAEIGRAALLGVPPKSDGSPDVEAWLREVTRQEGISLEIYRRDAVWPSVALRKLAGNNVIVSGEDLQRGFEANYGPRARCLAIVLNNQRIAQDVFDKARKNNTSEYFGYLAEQYSIEPGSRALRGEVPPIRKYGGQPVLEQEAFALKTGELSGVIQIEDKFVILRCEGFTQPAVNVNFTEVRDELHRDLYEKKLHLAMAEYFEKLQDAATIENYLTDASHLPNRRGQVPAEALRLPNVRQMPGKRG